METTATADFAKQVERAETKARCHEIAALIGRDLVSRPHRFAEHERLTQLRIQALAKSTKIHY